MRLEIHQMGLEIHQIEALLVGYVLCEVTQKLL